jgi:hypothetical protein
LVDDLGGRQPDEVAPLGGGGHRKRRGDGEQGNNEGETAKHAHT